MANDSPALGAPELLSWPIAPTIASDGEIAASVAGHSVKVWSDDAPLADTPEAWPTAFCIPASRAGAVLRSSGRVNKSWRAGADANVALAASWWGGANHLRLEEPGRRWPRRVKMRGAPAPGRAICFTGGVDSFYTALHGGHDPTHLVFVVGFDIDLEDHDRITSTIGILRDTAAHLGAHPIVVTTDLRSHPMFASVSWEHTHGAALATIAHLLHPTIGNLVIPPSYAWGRLIPWGSRPDLDPRWSVPNQTTIIHGGASIRRLDRVMAISTHPLVHEHLRVCWRNVTDTLNCGQCEKCLRTMMMLAAADQLQHCRTFPERALLPSILDNLERIDPHHLKAWSDFPDLRLRPAERTSLDALLARSALEGRD